VSALTYLLYLCRKFSGDTLKGDLYSAAVLAVGHDFLGSCTNLEVVLILFDSQSLLITLPPMICYVSQASGEQ